MGMSMSGFSTETVNLNTTSGATAIIAESQRSRLLYFSSWWRLQVGLATTRSLAVLLIALSCELKDFVAIVYTKENVAAKALADQLSDLALPTIRSFGRLIGRMEECKGEAYASKIDVRCSDRDKIIA